MNVVCRVITLSITQATDNARTCKNESARVTTGSWVLSRRRTGHVTSPTCPTPHGRLSPRIIGRDHPRGGWPCRPQRWREYLRPLLTPGWTRATPTASWQRPQPDVGVSVDVVPDRNPPTGSGSSPDVVERTNGSINHCRRLDRPYEASVTATKASSTSARSPYWYVDSTAAGNSTRVRLAAVSWRQEPGANPGRFRHCEGRALTASAAKPGAAGQRHRHSAGPQPDTATRHPTTRGENPEEAPDARGTPYRAVVHL